MTAEQKRLERLHILATLAQHGPMTARELVKRANHECVDDRFEALPDLNPRGITQKLNAISWSPPAIFVDIEHPVGDPPRWKITGKGREHLREHGVVV